MHKNRAAALGAALVLLLGGCSGESQPEEPSAPPEPEVLTATAAGGMYLDAVCPVNAAWDEAEIEIDRLRIAQGRGDTDTTRFVSAMERVRDASTRAAEALEPVDAQWPPAAEDAIVRVQDSLRADAVEAQAILALPIHEATGYDWQGAAAARESSEAARLALDLPADPVVACAQWSEQRAEPMTGGPNDPHANVHTLTPTTESSTP